MNTVKLSDKHMGVINTALEVYYRLKAGQVGIALDVAYDHKLQYNDREQIEKLVKDKALPELYDGYYVYNSEQIGAARIAYEIESVFRRYLAVKGNGGYFKFERDFHAPLKVSNEPLPEIEGFSEYKDFYLPDEMQGEARSLFCGGKYKDLWALVDTLPFRKTVEGVTSQMLFDDRGKLFVRVNEPKLKNL